jgi:predicted aldo/keto reductase-like oxidoreductase
MDRRDFILKSAIGISGASLAAPLLRAETEEEKKNPKIVYRTMGRTKLEVPVLSFGVMNTDSPDLIKKALDMGLKYLDTANAYLRGNSETSIGRVLKETGMRDKVYVATKVFLSRDWQKGVFSNEGSGFAPAATAENFNKQLDQSLGRLQTDHVDVLFVHACDSAAMVNYEVTMNAAMKAKEAGKARFIGVSGHKSAEIIRAAVDARVYDVVLATINFQLEDRDDVAKAIAYAKDNGVAIVAMKTQGGARRPGRPESPGDSAPFNHKAALKWALNLDGVCTAIPGMTTFDQLALNFSVMEDLALTEEDKKDLKLSSLNGGGYCQNCRACVPQCPHNVEVPSLMRATMYAEGYGNLSQAEFTLGILPEDRGLAACRGCSDCRVDCRNGMQVDRNVKTLRKQFYYSERFIS